MNYPPQVQKEHYCHTYDHKGRWLSYYYQTKTVLLASPESVLEVGPGNGMVTDYLRKQDIVVTTLDIDPALKPDIIASVLEIPCANDLFDLVMACEVLEHLPFEKFVLALRELTRVSKRYVFLSLPDHRRTLLYFRTKIPFLPEIAFRIRVPSYTKHIFDGQHYWEIGKIGYSPARIRAEIKKAGLKIIRDFVRHDTPMNHFFFMKKTT